MDKLSKGLKSAGLLAVLALYFALIWAGLSMADPQATSLTNLSTQPGPSRSVQNRSDPGGTITTISLNSINQNDFWKGYVGNITGALVLKNSQGQSIYEWGLDSSSFGGAVYVSKTTSLSWAALRCANRSQMQLEDASLGLLQSSSINRTFNNSVHKVLPTTIGGVATVGASTCNSTATYVNGSAQVLDASAKFQEILLSDESDLIYATFIDQDSWSYDNNGTNGGTYDFQMILPVNLTSTLYYFYADIV